jgi:hypothetical protein
MKNKESTLLPPHMPGGMPPSGAVLADVKKLAHINTYGNLPTHYVDYPFQCVDCASQEVWTAQKQKWYYEEAKGQIWAVALRCRAFRQKRKSGGASNAT